MRKLGFKVGGSTDYECLFRMLELGRLDFFPRGVNEIFLEYADRKDKYPGIVIEEHLALYLPQPNYFFVSPTTPRLATRLREGMWSIIRDGTYDTMFMEYFGDHVANANLGNRRIIFLQNMDLSDETPLDQPELWYHPAKVAKDVSRQ